MLLQENLLRTGKGKTFQWFPNALEAHRELQLRCQDPWSRPLQGQSPLRGRSAWWSGPGELLPSVQTPCSGSSP